jgi:hypothetical protein
MNSRFPKLAVLLVVLAATVVMGQSRGPQQIDEFGKLNAEDADARLSAAMGRLSARIVDHPSSMLEFVMRRGQNQAIGEPYHTFGFIKAFFVAEHFDPKRIVATICEPAPKQYQEVWLIDSLEQRHTCTADHLKLDTYSLFVTSIAANPKYELGGCCVIDEVSYAATLETVRSFADFVNAYSGTTAYIVVYGGTNVYGMSFAGGPEKQIRHVDPPTFIAKLGKDVRHQLLTSGLDRSRVISLNGGYRDGYASVDLWIIPPGGKRPKPSPNYAVK